MTATTVPASRFGWQGQTVEYVVKTDAGSKVTAPAKCADGLQVRVLETRRVGDVTEARVAVDVAGPVFY